MASSTRPLDGKLGLVTGASRGIGAAIAANLASKGCSLILNYTSPSSLSSTTTLAERFEKEHGIRTLVVQADMGSATGPASLIAAAVSHFGSTFKLDILINNAGVSNNLLLQDVTISDFDWQYKVNVLGPLLLTQAAIPYLPHDRSGRIVNLSSVSSSLGYLQQTVYGGTKAALEAMTRTWARELVERATVNAINPGPVKTDMWAKTTPEFKKNLKPFMEQTPGGAVRDIDDEDLKADVENAGGRPAYVSEIAGVVAMLCSQDSVWCTGQVVCANGGMRMAM